MTPPATSDAVRARMRAQRTRDTVPEMAVRRSMHALGLRYRVGVRVAGCRPDAVFPTERVAVFVDGCFWHRCPEHSRPTRANTGWWAAKLDANAARDVRQSAALVAAGWLVLRAWEHDAPAGFAERVAAAVRARRAAKAAA